jgi:hypothetical protein
MKPYDILDWIGRVPLVLLVFLYHKATETPASVEACVLATGLLLAQFAAIGTCLYLRTPEASK